MSSLNINNDYTSQNRTISFESYGEYRKRVLTRLEIERYVKDSLSLEDRVICTLITQHQVFITSTGKIVLNEVSLYLQKRGIPSLIIKRIVSFCESLITRYPATSYCWKCGKVDPFTGLPKNTRVLLARYEERNQGVLEDIYEHRMKWSVNFEYYLCLSIEKKGILPFHKGKSCLCLEYNNSRDCKHCPVSGLIINYRLTGEDYVEVDSPQD